MYVYSVKMCETVTSSAAVAGHYSAVHIRMSVLQEVHYPAGLTACLGEQGLHVRVTTSGRATGNTNN